MNWPHALLNITFSKRNLTFCALQQDFVGRLNGYRD